MYIINLSREFVMIEYVVIGVGAGHFMSFVFIKYCLVESDSITPKPGWDKVVYSVVVVHTSIGVLVIVLILLAITMQYVIVGLVTRIVLK